MFRLITIGLLCLLARRSVAPAGPVFVWHEVPGATATAIAVLWAHGDDDVEHVPGFSHVLAECRLERLRSRVPAMLASGASVALDASIVFGMVAADAAADAAALLEALLHDEAPWTDDEIHLVLGRVALAADDHEFLYPGTMLRQRGRRALCTGVSRRGHVGDPASILGLTPAAVRQRLQDPVTVRGAAFGAASAAMRTAVAKVAWPPPSPHFALSVEPTGVVPSAATMPMERQHRLDSPFVAAACLAPPTADWPAFALGVEVLRMRAHRRFRLRGQEIMGHAPLVQWSWLDADPLLVCCRRGADFERLLPGQQAAADADAECLATRRELESFLQSLRSEPPLANELSLAVAALQAEMGLPAGESTKLFASNPKALPGRLLTWLMASHRGIDVTRLPQVPLATVRQVLERVLAPDRVSWHALLPRARTDVGWPRR